MIRNAHPIQFAKAVFVAATLAAGAAWAGPEANIDATGVFLHGYDPVAYFTEGRPVAGKADIAYEHGGGKYLFASTASRDRFAASPEKYAPQYGGYCAFGVSVGKKFDVDPASFKIVGGKLYVNLNPQIAEKWSGDAAGNIAKADANWPGIRAKAPSEL